MKSDEIQEIEEIKEMNEINEISKIGSYFGPYFGWVGGFFMTRVHTNDEDVLGPAICMSSRRGPLFF